MQTKQTLKHGESKRQQPKGLNKEGTKGNDGLAKARGKVNSPRAVLIGHETMKNQRQAWTCTKLNPPGLQGLSTRRPKNWTSPGVRNGAIICPCTGHRPQATGNLETGNGKRRVAGQLVQLQLQAGSSGSSIQAKQAAVSSNFPFSTLQLHTSASVPRPLLECLSAHPSTGKQARAQG